MRRRGEALIYERIPRYRRQLRDEVHALVIHAEETAESSTIPDFYLQRVEQYLAAPAPWILPFLREEQSASHDLLKELEARERYFSDDEKRLAEELHEWIETKANLDFQEASMRILKVWLFIHIPLSFSLILLSFVHGILVLLHGGNG